MKIRLSTINEFLTICSIVGLLFYFFADSLKKPMYKFLANQSCEAVADFEQCTNREAIEACKVKAFNNFIEHDKKNGQ